MEYFRRIMIVGRAIRQRGLIYSGSEVSHISAVGSRRTKKLRVVFWFWTPPDRRSRCDLETEVVDARDFERKALADGVIEEVAFNWEIAEGLPRQVRDQVLKTMWDLRCFRRLGFVPGGGGKDVISVSPEAQQAE